MTVCFIIQRSYLTVAMHFIYLAASMLHIIESTQIL